MRLPLSKVYRAFPELDQFDDERCEAYARTASRMQRGTRALQLVGSALLFFPGTCLGGGVVTAVIAPVLDNPRASAWLVVPLIVLLLLGFVGPGVLALVLRDVWLRGAIKRQLKTSLCPGCRYQLLGLPVSRGAVLCPECGMHHDLAMLGLTPADLLAPALHNGPHRADQ